MFVNWEFCQADQIFSVLGRLCLIVSLWQGPIPWLHCHDAKLAEISSPVTASNLRIHLASFHSNTEHELGWHCHWILPCWNHFFGKNYQHKPPSNESISLDTIVSQPNVANTLQGLAIAEFVCHRFIHDSEGKDCSAWRCRARFNPTLPREMSAVLRC